jgi:hypothetical protein
MSINDSIRRQISLSEYASYDYLEIYNESVLGSQTLEEKIEEIRLSKKAYKYIVKTIQSGDMLESEIYPVYEKRKDIPVREKVEKITNEWQEKLNEKNAKKKYVRLVNANFTKNDLLVTLTYKDKYLPTQKQAKKDVVNYLNRIKRYRKKLGLEELKYLYVLEYVDEPDQHKSKKIRVHHHIIMNQMDRDMAEDIWGKGRAEAKRLKPDEFGLEGIARYMVKDPKGKRWYGSRNLKQPTVTRSKTKLTKRKAEKIARNENQHKELFETLYSEKYIFNDCNTFLSDITGGFYLYCRMRRRD